MFVIQRGIPKLYKGFKIILEDSAGEIPTWERFNGFRIVDPVQNEGEERKVDNGLADAPIKKVKLG